MPMAGTSTMVDDVVPISVEGSSRMVENQMPVGSGVTFFSPHSPFGWFLGQIF